MLQTIQCEKLLIRLAQISNFTGRVRQRRAQSAASQPALSALALAPHPHADTNEWTVLLP